MINMNNSEFNMLLHADAPKKRRFYTGNYRHRMYISLGDGDEIDLIFDKSETVNEILLKIQLISQDCQS